MQQMLTIDLLPPEYKSTQLKKAKFFKVQSIGIAIVMLTAFIASAIVALRILQTQQTLQAQEHLSETEQKVTELKTTQGYLVLLKNRLSTISQYLGVPSKQAQMYGLINKLLPPTVAINTISIDKNGEVLILATSTDSDSLDNFIGDFLSKETNEDKIKEVSLESLNRGKDGIYRLSFKIKPK